MLRVGAGGFSVPARPCLATTFYPCRLSRAGHHIHRAPSKRVGEAWWRTTHVGIGPVSDPVLLR